MVLTNDKPDRSPPDQVKDAPKRGAPGNWLLSSLLLGAFIGVWGGLYWATIADALYGIGHDGVGGRLSRTDGERIGLYTRWVFGGAAAGGAAVVALTGMLLALTRLPFARRIRERRRGRRAASQSSCE